MKITVFNRYLTGELHPLCISLELARLYPNEYEVEIHTLSTKFLPFYKGQKPTENVKIHYRSKIASQLPNPPGLFSKKIRKHPLYITHIPKRITTSDIFFTDSPFLPNIIPYTYGKAKRKIAFNSDLEWIDEFSNANSKILKAKKNLVDKQIQKTNLIISKCTSMTEYWQKNYDKPILQIPFGYWPKSYTEITEEEKQKIKEKYDIQDKTIILYPGANTEEHTCYKLLEKAMPEIQKEIPSTIILRAGKTKQDKYTKTVGEYINRTEIAKLYQIADITILPKKDDIHQRTSGHVLKFTDALGAGLPTITPPLAAAEDAPENTYLKIKAGDSKEIAKAAINLLQDEKLQKKISTHAKEYAEKNLTWENIACKFHEKTSEIKT